MDIRYDLSDDDLQPFQEILDAHANDDYVVETRAAATAEVWNRPDEEAVWRAILRCQCTSMQRSGEGKPVWNFFAGEPAPCEQLSLARLSEADDVWGYAQGVLEGARLRFHRNIAGQIVKNRERFYGDEGLVMDDALAALVTPTGFSDPDVASRLALERTAAWNLLYSRSTHKVSGFGPKQSRHFLKSIGLARWTLPIDSRLLNGIYPLLFDGADELGWFSTSAMADEGVYRMAENLFIRIALALGITTVELDSVLWLHWE